MLYFFNLKSVIIINLVIIY